MPDTASLTEIEATALYELRYHSTRSEVWRWYWRQWRKRWWRLHAVSAVAVVIWIFAIFQSKIDLIWILPIFLICFPVVVLLFASWPQIKFKSDERILKIGPLGWSTRIARLSGAKSWRDVASVDETERNVSIVMTNGNALIVPRDALGPNDEWEKFLADLKMWRSSPKP